MEAASPCKHAGRAKLADSASVLVDSPPSLPPDRVLTIFTEPYRHRTVETARNLKDGVDSQPCQYWGGYSISEN